MRITTKGQVTIPLSVRKSLGMHPGTEVEIVKNGNTASIRKASSGSRPSRGERAVELLAGSATDMSLGMTTDEILLLTRGDD
ncbi:MAG: AbrB/MazE/SpoVT family DNA-binding domain-containing protein [Pyrinomonadaceae bacterium]